MKLRFAFLGLLSLIAVSCSYEEAFVPEENNDNSAVEFYATIDEQPDADTKVYADDQLRVLWNEDDRITIFSKFTYNQEYRFLGEDGDNAGSFRKVPNDDYVTGNDLSKSYAIYPYLESTKISNGGVITFTLPSEQIYHPNTFGIGANTMVSVSETNELRFKNVGGYLSLKFFGEGVSISSITLKGNNGELLAGKCSIDMSSGLPVLSLDDSKATDTITLVCDPAVDMDNSSTEAIAFWFVLPPVTFSNGITVTVTTSDGGVFEKSTSNKLEIGRSAITKLGALEVVPEYVQPNNVIYYTSTDGEIVAPYAPDVFGANIVSNEYIDGRGILTFDGDVTNIGSSAFEETNLTSVTIPGSVTSIGNRAFYHCSLTSAFIPESVMTIGKASFSNCRALMSFSGKFVSSDGLFLIDQGVLISVADGAVDGSVTIPDDITVIGDQSFDGCTGLTDITIPESITSIENLAFIGCEGLTHVVIPNGVTSIGYLAFAACKNLTSITVMAKTPPTGGISMFPPTKDYTIYVPAESVEAYKAAEYWSDYADRIQAIPLVPVPEAIDLGLPSGTKWASFNLGASDSNEAGDYFAWGETSTKQSFTKKNYKFFQPGTWPESYYATKYCPTIEDGYLGYTDNYTVLTPDDDVATLLLGAGWRIPTMEEYQELVDNCTFTKVSNGWKVKSNVNGNSIFFPAVGYKQNGGSSSGFCCYWSSSLHVPSNGAYIAHFNEYASPQISANNHYYSRAAGLPIRPVYSANTVGITDLTLDNSTVSILTRRSQQLHAEVINTSATVNSYIEWSSSDPSIATVDYQGNVFGVAPGTATISARVVFTSIVKTCEVTVTHNQLLTNNHEYVDLGLSVLWSTTNIGASSPEEFGDYYAWGDTSPYYSSLSPLVWKADKTDGYLWRNYKYCKGSKTTLTRYCNSLSSGYNSYTDAYTELLLEDDAAHVNWGGDWHIPSYYQATELIRKCKWEKATINSVEGYLVTGPNGNSIFLPSAGYYEQVYFRKGDKYWTNTLYSWNSAEPEYAWCFGGTFVSDFDYVSGSRGNGFREYGYVIRPVCW